MRLIRWQVPVVLGALVTTMVAVPTSAAADVTTETVVMPKHSQVIAAITKAADYYRGTYKNTTIRPKNGWNWSSYMQGVLALYEVQGDPKYLADVKAWGTDNSWGISTEQNPDSIKALQVYYDLSKIDPSVPLQAADQKMAADLMNMPVSQYDWIDTAFMGLPTWSRWAERTGNPAYLTKLRNLYDYLEGHAADSARCAADPVPVDGIHGLFSFDDFFWYRDCRYVRDHHGDYWSRANGRMLAGLAQVLDTLPAGADPIGNLSISPVFLMAQADGLWRSALSDPNRFPLPESSGSALITYALAYGIRTGLLPTEHYLPALAKAWNGLSSLVTSGGFLRYCQPSATEPTQQYTGTAPRTAPTATSAGTLHVDSPPSCVGSFLLAGAEVAKLTTNLAFFSSVSATGQQAGNGAPSAVDGNVNTRWSVNGFPNALTVDLGSIYSVSNSMVVPYQNRAYKYRIETSVNATNWTLVVDKTANTAGGTRLDEFIGDTVVARYVRLTVTGVAGNSTTWASIQEFGVYDRLLPQVDLARGRPTSATSGQSGSSPGAATDGTPATWWSASAVPTVSAPQSINIDLGLTRPVGSVRLFARPGSGPRNATVSLSNAAGEPYRVVATVSLPNAGGPFTMVLGSAPAPTAKFVRLSTTGSYSTSTVTISQFEVFEPL
jgi:rhamnogalacturonyl hydrolase YesR